MINLGNFSSTISGPSLEVLKTKVVLGLDWLRTNKLYIDWETSTMIIPQNMVHHHMYAEGVEHILQDHMFVCITKTQSKQDNLGKVDWESYRYKEIHFKEI